MVFVRMDVHILYVWLGDCLSSAIVIVIRYSHSHFISLWVLGQSIHLAYHSSVPTANQCCSVLCLTTCVREWRNLHSIKSSLAEMLCLSSLTYLTLAWAKTRAELSSSFSEPISGGRAQLGLGNCKTHLWHEEGEIMKKKKKKRYDKEKPKWYSLFLSIPFCYHMGTNGWQSR